MKKRKLRKKLKKAQRENDFLKVKCRAMRVVNRDEINAREDLLQGVLDLREWINEFDIVSRGVLEERLDALLNEQRGRNETDDND